MCKLQPIFKCVPYLHNNCLVPIGVMTVWFLDSRAVPSILQINKTFLNVYNSHQILSNRIIEVFEAETGSYSS